MAMAGKIGQRPAAKRAGLAWLWTAFWAGILLLAVAAMYVPPTTAPFLAPFGLLFPWALACSAAGAVMLLVWARWRVLLWAAALLVLIAPELRATWGSSNAVPEDSDSKSLAVMTWNVRLFDFYGWIDGRQAPQRADDERLGLGSKARIFDQIADESPDILCLQEFYFHSDPAYFNTTDSLQAQTGLKFMHAEYTHHMHAQKFGVATFSRHPIVSRDVILFESDENNVCVVTDVLSGSDTLRIFNAHLSSLRFQTEDYQALEGGVPDAVERARLLSRLNTAYRRRIEQMGQVLAAVDRSPYPVVLCGDFNDTPVSYALHRAREQLCDAHDATFGVSGTWQGAIPGMRIDYILHDASFAACQYGQGGEGLSDHRWVAADLVPSAP